MILSFGDDTTHDLFRGVHSRSARKIPPSLNRKTRMLLALLDAATDIIDMASPPGNRLHKLHGNLNGFWSVSVNEQYRIIFRFDAGHASHVQVIDYH